MRQRKTMLCDFHVVTCCGDPMAIVRLRLPNGADTDQYHGKAIRKAGLHPHICESCYDDAYRVKHVTRQ